MYSWINPYIWRVELGLGRWHGAHSLLQYLAHNEFIVSVWLNQWMRIRGWKRILHTTFTCFLYHLLFNTMFNSLNFFTMFNCFYNTMKMCKNVLSTFETLSFCSLSFLCFRRITSFLLQFSSESDERLPLCGHPFFSLLNVWLPHFMHTEHLSPQVQYPVMFCWVFLSCLMGESIIRDGAIHLVSSKGC